MGKFFLTMFFMIALSESIVAQSYFVFNRFANNPIIKPAMLPDQDGASIASPCLIKAPEWIHKKLGKYYLYFANDNGTYIRLAYANDLKGPWKIHESGALRIEECICKNTAEPGVTVGTAANHIASPDIFVNHTSKEITLYYHCPLKNKGTKFEKDFSEFTLRATSNDGINFKSDTVKIADAYFRMFVWKGKYYGMGQGGNLFRSSNPKGTFEPGPNPFNKPNLPSPLRHVSVKVVGDNLYVFYTRIGDKPERIFMSQIVLNPDWNTWRPSAPVFIVEPDKDYEGGNLPFTPSKPGPSKGQKRELRDPYIFEENSKWYLLYTAAGESGIVIGDFLLIHNKILPGKY